MNKAIQLAICLSAAAILAMATGCTKPPPPPVKEPVSPYIGLWESTMSRGETCTVRFTATEWESQLETGGIARPQYKGTYTQAGTRIDLMITHEVDIKTMGWVPQKGNLGPGLVGKLAGNKLTIPALINAELIKKH